jgi:isopenicillin N synthase-like dioxygenase
LSYATAAVIDKSAIPVISMAGLEQDDPAAAGRVGAEIRRAAETVGFFYVKDHGIPAALIERARQAARRFFALPLEQKDRLRINAFHHGFLGIGKAKMTGNRKPDLKESFVWGFEAPAGESPDAPDNPFLGANRWPAEDPDFKAAVYAYFEAANDCGRRLLEAIALGMGLPERSFTARFARPISRASLTYYPPQPPDMGAEQFGVGAHSDFGCLTMLCQDEVGGLQVEAQDGRWVTAHPIADTLVVNIGDLLERWTNGKLRSIPHRVVNSSGRERYSLVVAVDPDFETPIDPAIACAPGETPKFPVTSCGDYVLSRFDQSFAYRAFRASR